MSGFLEPLTLSHISNMFTFPGFSGGCTCWPCVWVLSLGFLDVLLDGLSWSTFRHSTGAASRTEEVVSYPLYALAPGAWSDFCTECFSCVRFSRIVRLALFRAILHIRVFPI